jgi:excisionase family DNA binding protein
VTHNTKGDASVADTFDAQADPRLHVVGDGFTDVPGAAAYLGLSRAYVYNLMEAGKLSYAKFGRARRIPWSELRRFASKQLVVAG